MVNNMQKAIIKKDIMGLTANKRILVSLIVVPLAMTVVMPLIFISTILFSPLDSPDMLQFEQLLELSNIGSTNAAINNAQAKLISIVLNNIISLFFILIPIMAASIMAANSFVGEKEKKTLETLLYCPLQLKEIFSAKILASFLLSMAVSVFSFVVMLVVIETMLFIVTRSIILPNINWVIIMFLVSPAASIISINLIVRGSAKAKSSEEAQQSCLFLILPVILLIVGQASGLMMMSIYIFAILGAVLAFIAVLTLRGSFGKFKYETLLF
jgi:ABC-type Na+ efflux pump permease subunit